MEKVLEDYPHIVTLEKSLEINRQIQKCICKIYINEGGNGTGFFCFLTDPKSKNRIPVMITNNHIIGKNDLNNNNKIKISFNNDKTFNDIELDSNRKKYTNPDLDVTIIEIKNKDNIQKDSFLEIDDRILINDSEKLFISKTVYIIQYPQDLGASVSYGLINTIDSNNNEILHFCSTRKGSSGSPIMNLETNKIIGVHKGFSESYNFNKGEFLKIPINEFFSNKIIINKKNNEQITTKVENKNEILIKLKVEQVDVDKEVYFLDNTNESLEKNKNNVHIYLSELNENNTELFINQEKKRFDKFFKPTKEGIYEIKLKFKTYLTDCSYMFYYCRNIIEIDFSSFKTNNVNNMKSMFSFCPNLTKLDLSSFNTEKVENMSNMFANCCNLKKITLSSFNTKLVNSMKNMFSYCSQLTSIDISSFVASSNVNCEGMFDRCWNIKKLKVNNTFKGKLNIDNDGCETEYSE